MKKHNCLIAAVVGTAIATCSFGKPTSDALSAALVDRILPKEASFLSHDAILEELDMADKAAEDAWRSLKSQSEYDAYRTQMHGKYMRAIGGLDFRRTPLNAKVVGSFSRNSGWRDDDLAA